MPYVGRSAFAHKGGVHVAAMRRHPDAYQHIDPALVGNHMRVVVSELSGRGNVLSKAEELGVDVGAGDEVEALAAIKESEARGYSYEAAEASVALLLKRRSPDYQPLFTVLDYNVMVGRRRGTENYAEAVVKVEVGGEVMLTAAEGNGPVQRARRSAAQGARAVLSRPWSASTSRTTRCASSTARYGTSSTTRVLIDSRDDHGSWSTVGASTNIIEASFLALVDSIEHGLAESGARPAGGSRRVEPDPARGRTQETAGA